MRLDKLMMLLALSGGFAFATACTSEGDKGDDAGDDDDDAGDDDDDAGDDDDDDDTYTPPTADTALALAAYAGGGSVAGGAYAGAESIVIIAKSTEEVICEWTWTAAGVPSTASPCQDSAGNACDFAFDVTLANDGQNTAGDCYGVFGYTLGVDGGGPFGYGHIADYHYAGNAYGPAMMYYYTPASGAPMWVGVSTYSTYDAAASTWQYIWPIGYIAYTP